MKGFERKNKAYYYNKSLQGDILDIYDAWGNVIDIQGDENLANANPFRYRGYYFDKETNLYYLQSRYYDPEIGRMINADTLELLNNNFQSQISKNLFVYCNNNPITYIDATGEWAMTLKHLFMKITTILFHYDYNKKLKFNGIINGQGIHASARKAKMGLTTGENNGCGWIATYNALRLMGNTSTHPADIIRSYETCGMLVEGLLGVAPAAIKWYFRLKGYRVETRIVANIDKFVKKNNKRKKYASILCYAWGGNWKIGAHYITVRWNAKAKMFYMYNEGNDQPKALAESSLKKYIMGEGIVLALYNIYKK